MGCHPQTQEWKIIGALPQKKFEYSQKLEKIRIESDTPPFGGEFGLLALRVPKIKEPLLDMDSLFMSLFLNLMVISRIELPMFTS